MKVHASNKPDIQRNKTEQYPHYTKHNYKERNKDPKTSIAKAREDLNVGSLKNTAEDTKKKKAKLKGQKWFNNHSN